jgi:prephenate dehydratase
MTARVAVLGPDGTFTGAAAARIYPGAELLYLDDIEDVFRFSQDGKGCGVIAIENSLEGSVGRNLELLMKYDLKITAETTMDIRLALMAKKGVGIHDITAVMSHSHALAQCREYLGKNCPNARLDSVSSTTEAMRQAASSTSFAAVGSSEAGRKYNLVVLADAIEDMRSQTRFISIAKKASEGPKTSLIFAVRDEPGALYSILKTFSDSLINLTKIESRPSRKKLGEYVFFLDYESHAMKPDERNILHARLKERTTYFKDLGSYSLTP